MVVASRELVGRAGELQHIDALLQQARLGQGGVLTFSGEPGLGKTSLLNEARRRATDFAVIECGGVEWEAEFPFSALHELLRPLDEHLDQLPAPQRRELDAALGRGDGRAVQGFHVYAATLSLLLEATRRQPVLLIVDDLQWIDALSAQAIAFVGRRISSDAVAVLVATRPGGRLAGLPEPRQVTPLDRAAVGELAASEIGHALPDASIEALAQAAAGNPLAVVESAAHAGDRLWLRGSGLDGPLPVGALIERGFSSRLDGLSPEAVTAAEILAASVDSRDAVIRVALDRRGIDHGALTELGDHGVVDVDRGRWRFSHPLLRSITHRRTTPSARRTAHAALAESGVDPSVATWHAAAAASGPDPKLADALVDAAEGYARIGGALAAAAALERAADLTSDVECAAQRLTGAARAARSGGAPVTRVLELAERAAALATSDHTRCCADYESMIVRAHTQDATKLHRDMVALAERATSSAPHVAAGVMRNLLTDGILLGDPALARSARTRLREIEQVPHLNPHDRSISSATRLGYDVLFGDVDASSAAAFDTVVDGYRRTLCDGAPLLRDIGASVTVVVEALLWIERFDEADLLISRFRELAREQGDVLNELISSVSVAGMALRTAEWDQVEAAEQRALELTEICGVVSTGAMVVSIAHQVRAHRTGVVDEEALAAIDAVAQAAATPSVLEYTEGARGFAALATGAPATAAECLERVRAWKQEAGQVEPVAATWPVDLVQAYILAGDSERAHERLAELRVYADATRRRWALAAVPWLEAMLTEDDAAAFAHFELAIRRYPEARAPFEEARARLAFGQRLRRANRRADARVQLEAALATFEQLQSEPWAQRARRELGASGKGVRRAATHERDQLTLQERQVAALIAAGATNKEAAGELFLSPKTIESHLSRIYRKLGVSSRTQLAARWDDLGGG